jgi:FlaA1/EpsC-like NDP-sugar epimerase
VKQARVVGDREGLPGRPGWPARLATLLRRDVSLGLLDAGVVVVAYLVPLVLRFDGAVPTSYWRNFWIFASIVVVLHISANYVFGLYGQMWRYASVQEARRVVLAALTAGIVVIVGANWLGERVRYLPLSVLILGAVLSLVGFGAIRFQSRLFALRRSSATTDRKRVLVIGAGDAGAMFVKDVFRNPSIGLDPVGLIDDDPRKVGRSLHGVPVLGRRSDLPALVSRLRVDQVLLAIPSATSDVVRDVAALCEEAEVTLRVLPSVQELVDGRITARDIRDLSIEDLLGRQQVETDFEAVRAIIQGRRVLITGAGGSIGAEITRQVAALGPSALLLLDHDETHLHDVVVDLADGGTPELFLADIRDRERIHGLFQEQRPDVVFHAAAHKHLSLLERSPEEALRTNVIGTANVADAAVAAGVGRFVLISTDKSVRPVSVMGASKWLAEQVIRSLDGNGSIFSAVRFGNVLGSRGSVIPTFLQQIGRGGPVTVTDPSMARYFMSVHEAVQLVLQAAALSRGGEVFTLDMGEPINIMDLARKLIHLSGRVPGKDVGIVVVGQRPGEKLLEDLVDPEERPVRSQHPAIVVSRPERPDQAALRRALWELEALTAEARGVDLADRLKAISNSGVGTTDADLVASGGER